MSTRRLRRFAMGFLVGWAALLLLAPAAFAQTGYPPGTTSTGSGTTSGTTTGSTGTSGQPGTTGGGTTAGGTTAGGTTAGGTTAGGTTGTPQAPGANTNVLGEQLTNNPPSGSGGVLAFTGSTFIWVAVAALALLNLGGFLLLTASRRRRAAQVG